MSKHIPVLLDEVIKNLNPIDGGVYIDGTFGAGGYTSAILNTANCTVYAIDRDPDAINEGQELVDKYNGRLHLLEGTFGNMVSLVKSFGINYVDGVVLDIGVSSMQIDRAERGFSFQKDAKLDMRMSKSGESATDILNKYNEKEIADIIYKYGEERFSRRIAREIIEYRKTKKIETTYELANLVRKCIPCKHNDIDPATRTFQALRIFVNDELGQLQSGLEAAEVLLKPGARMAVVSFHSLEDRIVKAFISERSGKVSNPSRYFPMQQKSNTSLISITKKPITPSDLETKANPRARSSRLRVAQKAEGEKPWKK